MIGRFGLTTQTSNLSSPQGAPTTSSNNTNLSSISMNMNMNFMKKMSVGLSMPSMDAAAAMMTSAGTDKKAKTDVEERKAMISQTISILEDVHLQTASSHAGLIVAYTAKNMSPIVHSGVKFRWYRLPQGDGRVIEPIEESQKAWYAPTVDDIGCVICVQCEDNFDQGCSKYLECGPIKADPLLITMAESAVNNGMYEVKGVAVSLGLSAATSSIIDHSQHDPYYTVLAKDSAAFLQLNGLSTIEVDDQGIFISIPTPAGALKQKNHLFNTSRRGLRIPSSSGIKVMCAQPSSIVLKLPVTRKIVESPTGEDHFVVSNNEEDVRMKEFLNSSILAIPWSYEGHNLSPAAYIADNEAKLSAEDREKLLKEAEDDSINFANTVVALAEFISSVPEGMKELLLCFSCDSRLNRDGLALSMRALACQPHVATRLERKTVFPWLVSDGDGLPNSLTATNESDAEMKYRLKTVEEENSVLKRERNELAKQLLETKEENSLLKIKSPSIKSVPDYSDIEIKADETSILNDHRTRELSERVIELENKLSILTKREADSEKAQLEVESKYSKQLQELQRLKKLNDELSTKISNSQIYVDQQTSSYMRLELEQEKLVATIEDYELRIREMDKLKKELAQRDNIIADLRSQIEMFQKTVDYISIQCSEKDSLISSLHKQSNENSRKFQDRCDEYENKLTSFEADKRIIQDEFEKANEKIRTMEHIMGSFKSLESQLQASEEKSIRLSAEINHIQKKSESQTKDMKKMMKDNAQTLLEFERALARKSGECNELYFKLQELENELQQLKESSLVTQSASVTDAASIVLNKLSTSIHQHRASMSGSIATPAPDAPTISERTLLTATATVSSAAASAANVFRRLSISKTNLDIPDSNSTLSDS